MTKDPTLESLDELVRLIADKASDLAVLAGLNRVIEEHEEEMVREEIKRRWHE